jgi:hypothetical protein
MEVRADGLLELYLQRVEKHAVNPQVKHWIHQAITHMGGGNRSNRRGGSELVALLSEARQRAADFDEWHIVQLLQSSIDYAEGRILNQVMDEQYRLFEDGSRCESSRDYLAKTISAGVHFAVEGGQEYLINNPEATFTELFEHIESLGQDARFLEAPKDRPGRYRIPRGRAETAIWVERVLRNRVDIEDIQEEARRLVSSPEALVVFADDNAGQSLLMAAQLRKRANSLTDLRKLIEDPDASENDLQQAIIGQHWIFGGQYVRDEKAYRRLVSGDEYDVPLIRADGSLHIVELKLSMGLKKVGKKLVKRNHNEWTAAAPVNDAASQAISYLVGLDEHRGYLRDTMGIETRRASATVLIGHPDVQSDASEENITEAFRALNTHLVRVEILTYKELVDNAERSIGVPVDASSMI